MAKHETRLLLAHGRWKLHHLPWIISPLNLFLGGQIGVDEQSKFLHQSLRPSNKIGQRSSISDRHRVVAFRYLKIALTRCSCGEVLLHVPVHFHFGLEKKSKLVLVDNENTFSQIILKQLNVWIPVKRIWIMWTKGKSGGVLNHTLDLPSVTLDHHLHWYWYSVNTRPTPNQYLD